MRRLIARLGPYGLNTLVTLVTGLLSVPLIIVLAGSAQWTGLAVSQSVAAMAAVVVGFGWTATGPSTIAALAAADRPAVYWRSLQARTLLLLVAAPVAGWVSVAITGLDPAPAVLGTTAYLMQAVGGMWYFIGESRPYRVLLWDTLPRTLAILVALGALAMTRSLTVYTAILLAGTVAAALLAAVVILRGHPRPLVGWRGLGRELRAQRHGFIATSTGALYSNSPLIIASIIIPGPIDAFALAFKLFHYAVAAIQPIVQLLQGWVPAAGKGAVPGRVRRARGMAAVGAAILGIGMAALLPVAAWPLSAGSIAIDASLSVPFGVCLAAVFLNQIFGLACLPAVGRADALASSSAVGAGVGVILLCVLAAAAGEPGLAWALAATEALVAAIQLVVLSGALRRLAAAPGGPHLRSS